MSNEGKKVKVHYVGTLDDGTKFDSSRDRGEPLAFTCMAGQMIKGFDEAVREMEVGQVVDVRLEPAEAYGERDGSARWWTCAWSPPRPTASATSASSRPFPWLRCPVPRSSPLATA